MKSYDRVDQAIDNILRANRSSLKYYTMQKSLDDMRAAMREIISNAFNDGANVVINEFNKP